MMTVSAALLVFLIGPQTGSADAPRPAACGTPVTSDAAVGELCLGDDDLRLADALPKARRSGNGNSKLPRVTTAAR